MSQTSPPHLPAGEPVGQKMYRLVADLFPICRSITGDGVRRTLDILKRQVPLEVHEVPSGTPAFDWTVPQEWNITDACIKNPAGDRVVDFQKSNLHVVSYSVPIRQTLPLSAIRAHLFTLPDHPDWIPYRTAYYAERWGFCLSHRQFEALQEGEYEVCIQSSLRDGHLTYGEYLIPGETADEVLISCHVCHPSLCNDNLSGIALAAFLAEHLASQHPRYSYRFLFIPGAIGAIVWLSRNEARVRRIKHGLVLAGIGDRGGFTYKKSRRGDAEIDAAVAHVLKHSGTAHRILDFSPYGHDERQFCSPAFNLPVGCLMRTPHDEYPEYHTSADNLDFVSPDALGDAFSTALSVLRVIERNGAYRSTNPKCEPHLGKRGLYRAVAGQADGRSRELAMLWVLNLSDGDHSLLDIAARADLPFHRIHDAAQTLLSHGLLKEHASSSEASAGII